MSGFRGAICVKLKGRAICLNFNLFFVDLFVRYKDIQIIGVHNSIIEERQLNLRKFEGVNFLNKFLILLF